jgi:hypothetical protein
MKMNGRHLSKVIATASLAFLISTTSNAQTCNMVLNSQGAQTSTVNKSSKLDIMDRYRSGQTSSDEDMAIRNVMIASFNGVAPMIFSLNHLIAYDRVLLKYGVHGPLKASAVDKLNLNRGQKQKIWLQEQKKYSSQLRAFSKVIAEMTTQERRLMAKQITAEIFLENLAGSFVVPENFADYPQGITRDLNRLPLKQVNQLNQRHYVFKNQDSALSREVLEDIVYESLIPLSKLAITDRIKDRVGGRIAFQGSNSSNARTIYATTSAVLIAGGTLWTAFQYGAPEYILFAGIGAFPVVWAVKNVSGRAITYMGRIPESIGDGLNDLRENFMRSMLWSRTQKPVDGKITPLSNVTMQQYSAFSIQAKNPDTEWKMLNFSLSKFGSETQEALNLLVNVHVTLKAEEVEQLESSAPLLALLEQNRFSDAKLKKIIAKGKFQQIDQELRDLDGRYFEIAKTSSELRKAIAEVDSKLAQYVQVLDANMSSDKSANGESETTLSLRRESLMRSREFVQIQLSAVDLTHKDALAKIQATEGLRTIILSSQSSSTFEPSSKLDRALSKLGSLLQGPANGAVK